ncbi:MAG: adenylate/guanylate cyclase domain-containing protein [Hyphomicrobiaceae bacterium]|nr:MAG: adenylate/guanylate cyclase domain-containing protein [Hyphomicrobiaceae bacterium]
MPWQPLKGRLDGGRLYAWQARLARLSAYGTAGYPPLIRRRLKILNVTAYVIAAFTLFYAVQQAFLDLQTWKPVILINLVMAAVALAVPFLHRFGDLAAALVLATSEIMGIFVLTYYLGRDAGLHLQYFSASAVFFVIMGLERLMLVGAFILASFALHLAGWLWFPQSRAVLTVDESEISAHYVTAVVTTFSFIALVVYYAFRLAERAQAETDALLHNILPRPIVERLKAVPGATIADEVGEGSVMFADLVGFVAIAKHIGPPRTVELLNTIMSAFDALAERWGVEKIKTIGDAYMVAAGVPEPVPDHAERIAGMALAMLETVRCLARVEHVTLALRIGIASGPVMAGVIGAKRLTYDVWGDTVNLASRLERQSQANRILVSEQTRARLEGRFVLEPRGAIDIKGFGAEEAWYLVAAADGSAPQTPAAARPEDSRRRTGI